MWHRGCLRLWNELDYDLRPETRETTMRTPTIRWMTASALVLLAACESATASDGGGDARMQMAAAGDDGASLTRSSDGARYQLSSAQGTVRFAARAYVRTSAGAWVELTDGAYEQVSVAASSAAGSAQLFATENVEATAYTRVRVVFRAVDADVQGGVSVGTGLLTGSVTVNAGSDDEIVVERAITVNARAGATTRLVLDLNSNVWLNQASAESHSVTEAAFASAVAVTAQ
jgi:hypothetical protein